MSNKKRIVKVAALSLACNLAFGSNAVLALSDLNNRLDQTKDSLNSIESNINKQDSEISNFQNQIDQTNQEKESVNSVLTELGNERAGLEAKIYEINALIQETLNKIYELEIQIIEITDNIADTELEIEQVKNQIQSNTELLRERIRVSYKLGDAEKIEILLTSTDINDFLSRNKMITTVAEHDRDLIESLKSDREKLDVLVLELNGNKKSLEISKENADKERLNLEQQMSVQAELLEQVRVQENEKFEELSNLNSEISDYQASLNEKVAEKAALSSEKEALNLEIAQLENEINEENARIERERIEAERQAESQRLAAEQAAQEKRRQELAALKEQQTTITQNYSNIEANTSSNSSGFAWPAATRNISSYYGWRSSPFGWGTEFHLGIDLAAGFGTPIYSSENGTVLEAQYHWSYGNYILIDHGNGLRTRYAHLQSMHVSPGQMVGKGQQIGGMGSTGSSTGSHLHYEVILNGSTVNPLGYIR